MFNELVLQVNPTSPPSRRCDRAERGGDGLIVLSAAARRDPDAGADLTGRAGTSGRHRGPRHLRAAGLDAGAAPGGAARRGIDRGR